MSIGERRVFTGAPSAAGYETIVPKDDPVRQIGRANLIKRAKGSTPPKLPIRAQAVDTSKVLPRIEGRLKNGEKRVYAASTGVGEWPLDSLVRLEVQRMIGVWEHSELPSVEGLMGHVIDLDYYCQSNRVTIKSYTDPPGLIVEVNGEEVWRWFENPDWRPSGKAAIAESIRRDGEFIAAADLRPGDECVEGEHGEVIVIRADEEGDPIDYKHCHRCGCDISCEPPWEPICDECYAIATAENEYGVDAVMNAINYHGEAWADHVAEYVGTLVQKDGESNLEFIVRAGILTDDDPVIEDDEDEVIEPDDDEIEWE